jgi:hypothetical protein
MIRSCRRTMGFLALSFVLNAIGPTAHAEMPCPNPCAPTDHVHKMGPGDTFYCKDPTNTCAPSAKDTRKSALVPANGALVPPPPTASFTLNPHAYGATTNKK